MPTIAAASDQKGAAAGGRVAGREARPSALTVHDGRGGHREERRAHRRRALARPDTPTPPSSAASRAATAPPSAEPMPPTIWATNNTLRVWRWAPAGDMVQDYRSAPSGNRSDTAAGPAVSLNRPIAGRTVERHASAPRDRHPGASERSERHECRRTRPRGSGPDRSLPPSNACSAGAASGNGVSPAGPRARPPGVCPAPRWPPH